MIRPAGTRALPIAVSFLLMKLADVANTTLGFVGIPQ
jgi:hypothetical protein